MDTTSAQVLAPPSSTGQTTVALTTQGTSVTVGPAKAGAAALILDCLALQGDTETQLVIWAGADGAPTLAPPDDVGRRYLAVVTIPPHRWGTPPAPNAPAPLLPLDMAAVRIAPWPLPPGTSAGTGTA